MKFINKHIYTKMVNLMCANEWKNQSKNNLKTLDFAENMENEIKVGDNEYILVISPHADDEFIGCYNILKNYKGNLVAFYCGMTGDDKSVENKETRAREFLNLCNEIGCQCVIEKENWYNGLDRLLDERNIKYIFIPTLVDWHAEHRKTHINTIKLVKNKKKSVTIFCYQITVPIAEKYITHYFRLSRKEQLKKWNTFKKIYISQGFMPVQRLKEAEKMYTKGTSRIASEVFMKLNDSELDFAENNSGEYVNDNEIKSALNNLGKMKEKTEIEYDMLYHEKGKIIDIKTIQKKETEMLAYIDRVFKKNNIDYCLYAGSALGAIRHSGPIPWDDDVDIVIPVNMLEKAMKVLQKELPEEYKLFYEEDNKYNRILFPRLCLAGNHPLTAYVDIFLLLGAPDDEKKQLDFLAKLKLVEKFYCLKYEDINRVMNKYKRVAAFIIKNIFKFIPYKFWLFVNEKYLYKYSYEDSEYTICMCGSYEKKQIMKKSMYEDVIYVPYEKIQVPVSSEYDEFLRQLYGDYMKFPSEEIMKKGMGIKKVYYEYGVENNG